MSRPKNDLNQNQAASDVLVRDREFLMPVYPRFQVVMERGDGVYLFDTSGNRYLDFMGGLGVNALGHAHPRMVKATAEQAAKMVHLSPQYSSEAMVDLSEKLCALSGMKSVFYSTGGSEAVEGALKLAHAYGNLRFGPHKTRIVALHGAYHGRTYGSLSVTLQDKYQENFGPLLPGIDAAYREDFEGLEAAVSDDTCAILLEPVLGEGGVHELSDAYLAHARKLADKHNALLIFDEIQCGLGRTGEWFAYQKSGVKPDALILGKPLGGGLPLSALLVTEDLKTVLGLGKHGSTLGGSPLVCRLGMEFLQVVEDENLLTNVLETGAYLRAQLETLVEECSVAVEARGRGLIQALELTVPGRPIAEAALAQGFMLNVVQGNTLRFLPSFLLTPEHVDAVMPLLRKLLNEAAVEQESQVAVAAAR